MSAPLLTVIVPAYNSEDYLDRALTTLVGYGDELEAIVVNDGSKDRTAEIADEWAARYPSVKVIHQENKGHGGAVNAGLAAATGTHVRASTPMTGWTDAPQTPFSTSCARNARPGVTSICSSPTTSTTSRESRSRPSSATATFCLADAPSVGPICADAATTSTS